MRERPARVPRLHVGAELRQGETLELPEDTAHHATRVLRLGEGAAVVLFDGHGGEHPARLALRGRGRVAAEVGERRDPERESPLQATLVQALSSSDKMDLTIQKAVELGVAAIQPVLSARSVVRLEGERGAKKLAHWRRVAIAACEQCGRNTVPELGAPIALVRYRPAEGASKILLSPAGEAKLKTLAKPPVILAVGPEAGFSDDEEAWLERAGFARVRLGRRVLRTETAALAALAALNALAGDF